MWFQRIRIPKLKFSGFRIDQMQKFPSFQNPDSLTWGGLFFITSSHWPNMEETGNIQSLPSMIVYCRLACNVVTPCSSTVLACWVQNSKEFKAMRRRNGSQFFSLYSETLPRKRESVYELVGVLRTLEIFYWINNKTITEFVFPIKNYANLNGVYYLFWPIPSSIGIVRHIIISLHVINC